jgi:uncharacterized protein with HEPN domain
MPSKDALTALRDVLDHALLAQGFVEDFDLEQFRQDRRTYFAVVRCLEIISEASRRIDDDIKLRHPGIEWRAMAGSGNVYRHDYGNVTPDLVWRTATGRMDELISMARQELSHES